jgi:hypothetical protein
MSIGKTKLKTINKSRCYGFKKISKLNIIQMGIFWEHPWDIILAMFGIASGLPAFC